MTPICKACEVHCACPAWLAQACASLFRKRIFTAHHMTIRHRAGQFSWPLKESLQANMRARKKKPQARKRDASITPNVVARSVSDVAISCAVAKR